jgi:hypothetical protein
MPWLSGHTAAAPLARGRVRIGVRVQRRPGAPIGDLAGMGPGRRGLSLEGGVVERCLKVPDGTYRLDLEGVDRWAPASRYVRAPERELPGGARAVA